MVREALAGGGTRAQHFKAGMVRGKHYLELVEPIKQLKRERRLQEALELCYRAIEGAEKDTEPFLVLPAPSAGFFAPEPAPVTAGGDNGQFCCISFDCCVSKGLPNLRSAAHGVSHGTGASPH